MILVVSDALSQKLVLLCVFYVDAADSSDSPNESLFKLLLENMERLNDREVTLTDVDWRRFTQHVQSRNRSGIPLPFPEELFTAEECGQSTSQESSKDKKPRNKSASAIKWRCFIRAVTALGFVRLIITFLPASYKYVKLMCKHGRGRSSSMGSMSPRSSARTDEKDPKGAKQECNVTEGEAGVTKQSSLLTQGSLEGLPNKRLLLS